MDDVITDVKQVTPDWLTTLLRTNGHLGHERVPVVTLKSSRQTIISNTHHLEITYSAVESERSPSKLFLKLSKPGFDSELAARLGKRESEYYNVIAKSMNDPPSATCYDAAFSPDNGKSHMLLVDLSDTHFQNDWPIPPSSPTARQFWILLQGSTRRGGTILSWETPSASFSFPSGSGPQNCGRPFGGLILKERPWLSRIWSAKSCWKVRAKASLIPQYRGHYEDR